MLTGTENNLALPAFVLLDQVSPDDTMARNIMQTIAESKAAENARKRTPSIGHKFSTVLGISKKSNANSAAGICSFSFSFDCVQRVLLNLSYLSIPCVLKFRIFLSDGQLLRQWVEKP